MGLISRVSSRTYRDSNQKKIPKMSTDRSINGRTISNSAYFKLGFYTLLMMTCPLIAFFYVRNYFRNNDLDLLVSNIRGAIAAVAIAHGVIFMFVYSAWQEDKEVIAKKKD